MIRRRRSHSDTPVEQDSFLDIIANLVGILIILVVIFGAQIGESLSQKPSEELQDLQAQLAEHQAVWTRDRQVLDQREAEHRDWQVVLDQQDVLIQQRRLERHLALQHLASVNQQVAVEGETLSAEQQELIRLQKIEVDQAAELDRLNASLESVRLASVEVVEPTRQEIIEHYPTPIAKTVFGREVHFQLREDRIVYVPFDELVQRLKATWETHAEHLAVGQTTTETLGPIADFRLQYELNSQEKTMPTANGVVSSRVVALSRFWLLPVRPNLGEAMAAVERPDSRFNEALAKYNPQDTTVSIWVYPESYETFLTLRKLLIKRGYRVAVWPLTPDQRISGSPDGLRSTAQ
jgi:hypothetical protein